MEKIMKIKDYTELLQKWDLSTKAILINIGELGTVLKKFKMFIEQQNNFI